MKKISCFSFFSKKFNKFSSLFTLPLILLNRKKLTEMVKENVNGNFLFGNPIARTKN